MIAVTDEVKEQLKYFLPKDICPKIYRSYPGADDIKSISKKQIKSIKDELGIKDEYLICIVGRVEENKGQRMLLEATKELKKEGLNLKVLVIGHAMEQSYLSSLKSRYSEDIFIDFTTKVSHYMQVCSCLVLATKKETFGLVIVEAMRANLPVTSSALSGPSEIIKDKEDGLLFTTKDQLKDRIKFFYQNKEIAKKYAKAAKTKADMMFDKKIQFIDVKNILKSS